MRQNAPRPQRQLPATSDPNLQALAPARPRAVVKRRLTFREALHKWLLIAARWNRVGWMFWGALFNWLITTVALRLGRRRVDNRPRILREFLENAGGAWIKLGQILAMRSDFLPPEFIDELSRLLDKVPPFPYEVAREIIEEDFGRPLEDIFAVFPKETIAAASFGQVYRVVLHSGAVTAVKVQRPGLEVIIAGDVAQLRILGFFIDGLRLLGSIRLKPQIIQLAQILREEIDYHFEADNIRHAYDKSRYMRTMRVPKVYDEYCSTRVLTMEFLEGTWMNEILSAIRDKDELRLHELRRRGLDFRLIARRMFDIGMRQLFEVGTFHADPHAANIVILENNVVGYVDFGITGEMDRGLAESQSRYFEAVKEGEVLEAAHAMAEMVVVPSNARHKLPAFRRRLATLIQDWLKHMRDEDASIREKSTAQLILNNIAVIREFGFFLLEDAMRYYRALIISDIIMLQLDSDFDAVRNLKRYYRRRQIKELRVEFTREQIISVMASYAQLWLAGPTFAAKIRRLLQRDQEGIGEIFSRIDLFYQYLTRFSSWGLILVLILRAFGIKEFGHFIHLPFPVDWLWLSIVLFISWRIGVLMSR